MITVADVKNGQCFRLFFLNIPYLKLNNNFYDLNDNRLLSEGLASIVPIVLLDFVDKI